MSEHRAIGPSRIDHAGCTCTDCFLERSVPLERATATQIYDMLQGRISNYTGIHNATFLTVCDGDGKVVRIIKPDKNHEFLDALRENDWRIR